MIEIKTEKVPGGMNLFKKTKEEKEEIKVAKANYKKFLKQTNQNGK